MNRYSLFCVYKKSANDALIKCNQTICGRMKGKKNTEGCQKYFFYLNKDGSISAPSEKCVELMAFWELYREVATDSDMLEVKDLWIMQILFEVSCLETLWENQNLKKRLSPKESMNLQMLVEEIHEPISKKYLVLLKPTKEKYSIWKKVDLNRFIDGAIFAEKENVENHIIMMRFGGIVAWVVGREGLTPQRIYGYKVHGERCEKYAALIPNTPMWTGDLIKKILINPIYTGAMVNHKSKNTVVSVKSPVCIPRKDWVIVPNMHEAIMTKAEMDTILSMQVIYNTKSKQPNRNIFRGKIRCGYCNMCMKAKMNVKNKRIYCKTPGRISDTKCYKGSYLLEDLKDLLIKLIRQQALIADDTIRKMKALNKTLNIPRMKKQDAGYEEKIRQSKFEKMELYEQYASGVLSKNAYIREREKIVSKGIHRIRYTKAGRAEYQCRGYARNVSVGRCKCSCVDNSFCSGIWNCNTKEKPERYFIGNELGGRRKC